MSTASTAATTGAEPLDELTNADIAELKAAAQEYDDSADACDTPGLARFRAARRIRAARLRAIAERIAQLVALARENERIVDLVCADGSHVHPSKINPGRVVVVDGRSGLDASETSAAACFDALFDEADRAARAPAGPGGENA